MLDPDSTPITGTLHEDLFAFLCTSHWRNRQNCYTTHKRFQTSLKCIKFEKLKWIEKSINYLNQVLPEYKSYV